MRTRTTRHAAAAALSAAAVALAAGCGFFSRPEIRHFALETIVPAAPPPAAAAAGPPLGIAGVTLPPGLDRREIVVRGEDGRLDVRGTDLWAAPLGPLVHHTLAFDLAARLPDGAVVLPGQTLPVGGVRALDVVFTDLAAGPGPTLVLDARWTHAAGAADAAPRAGHERIEEPLGSLDSAEVAAGTSRALARLADRLAAAGGGSSGG